jgi:hypothetical protein
MNVAVALTCCIASSLHDFPTLWTLDLGPWTLDLGPWTLDLGPWTSDLGPWTLDLGLWSLDLAELTWDLGLATVRHCGPGRGRSRDDSFVFRCQSDTLETNHFLHSHESMISLAICSVRSADLKLSSSGRGATLELRPGLGKSSVSQEVPTAIRLNLLAVTLPRAWNIRIGMWQLVISWISNAGKARKRCPRREKVNFENGNAKKGFFFPL